MPRIACLLIPNFPLAARLRCEPQIAQAPVAVLEVDGPASSIIAVSLKARQRGIRPGLSLPQARALFPTLIAAPRDPAAERSAQEALLETASGLSPVVENSDMGCVFIDLQGVRDEKALAEEALRAAAAVGLCVRVGAAGGRVAARLAARLSPRKPTLLPKGGDAAYLAPLPLGWLNASPALIERLSRWGIRTAGEFAALPAGEIIRRLGAEGLALHRAARGEEERPLTAWRRPPALSEAIEMEWTVCEMEAFAAVVRPMLDRLTSRLTASGVACRQLDLSLALDPKGEERRLLPLAAPTTEVRTLLELIQLELTAHPPAAPIVGITLLAHPDQARQVQFSLFGPAVHSPDGLATVMARLSVLLGAERIGSPRRVDGTRPERHAVSEYAPPPPPKIAPLLERHPLAAAVRVLRPRVPLEVQMGGSPPAPIFIKTEHGKQASPSISGKVRVAAGPWRLEEGWWSEEGVARDYWDLELTDGAVYRIFRDLQQEGWFADGIYD